jgi:hypothetical protein
MSEKQEEPTNTEPTVESSPDQEGEDTKNPTGSIGQTGDDDQEEEEKEKEVP